MNSIRVILILLTLVLLAQGVPAIDCGDVDLNGHIDISDLVYLVAYMFDGGPSLPACP